MARNFWSFEQIGETPIEKSGEKGANKPSIPVKSSPSPRTQESPAKLRPPAPPQPPN